jgi:hypothetical protein
MTQGIQNDRRKQLNDGLKWIVERCDDRHADYDHMSPEDTANAIIKMSNILNDLFVQGFEQVSEAKKYVEQIRKPGDQYPHWHDPYGLSPNQMAHDVSQFAYDWANGATRKEYDKATQMMFYQRLSKAHGHIQAIKKDVPRNRL